MIGTLKRDAADSFEIGVDFSAVDVFDSVAIISATATVTPTGLTLGSVSVSSNVATFRVSGGTNGIFYTLQIQATNGTDIVNRKLGCDTQDM